MKKHAHTHTYHLTDHFRRKYKYMQSRQFLEWFSLSPSAWLRDVHTFMGVPSLCTWIYLRLMLAIKSMFAKIDD